MRCTGKREECGKHHTHNGEYIITTVVILSSNKESLEVTPWIEVIKAMMIGW
jgi:hypothetical protein